LLTLEADASGIVDDETFTSIVDWNLPLNSGVKAEAGRDTDGLLASLLASLLSSLWRLRSITVATIIVIDYALDTRHGLETGRNGADDPVSIEDLTYGSWRGPAREADAARLSGGEVRELSIKRYAALSGTVKAAGSRDAYCFHLRGELRGCRCEAGGNERRSGVGQNGLHVVENEM
jgi:hypothetical protein